MTENQSEAVDLLRTALQLLDDSAAPLHIGAQLESVIDQLQRSIARPDAATSRQVGAARQACTDEMLSE